MKTNKEKEMSKLLLGVEMKDAQPLGIGTRREKRGEAWRLLRGMGATRILMIRALEKAHLNR